MSAVLRSPWKAGEGHGLVPWQTVGIWLAQDWMALGGGGLEHSGCPPPGGLQGGGCYHSEQERGPMEHRG